jgi:hypothetical protein
VFAKFQRLAELRPDFLALQYIYKAGYEPADYVTLPRTAYSDGVTGPRIPDELRPTSRLSERIARAEKEIRKILPRTSPRASASKNFILLKSHRSPPRVPDPSHRPTL